MTVICAAVVIPARNEETRLPACLDALDLAIRQLERPVMVIVVVNDSTDATAAVARRRLSDFSTPGTVLEITQTVGVGAARAAGFEHALRHCGDDVVLCGTDADSRVDAHWLTTLMDELRRADLILGNVSPDLGELADIGPMKARHNSAEGLYMQAAIRLAARLDPLPYDPEPLHHNASGANFALRGRHYRLIGGVPLLHLSEDREMARQAERFDLRIRHATAPHVVTSCRLDGRTTGGMAAALRDRAGQDDPLCDEWLEPADNFIARYRLKAQLRRAWPDKATLVAMGLPIQNLHDYPYFGAFWQSLEDASIDLARHRIRQSAAARDLSVLQDALQSFDRYPLQKAHAG